MKRGLSGPLFGLGAAAVLAGGTIWLVLDQPEPGPGPDRDTQTQSILPDGGKARAPGLKTDRTMAQPQPLPQSGLALKQGLDALTADDFITAMQIRDSLPDGIDRQALSFAIAMSGLPGVPAVEIDRIRKDLKGWPGLDNLKRLEEHALFRDRNDAATVLGLLGTTQAETAEGSVAQVRALLETGKVEDAKAVLVRLWRTEVMYPALETRILNDHAGLLGEADHRARMVRLLFADRIAASARFATLARAEALQAAFAAVDAKAGDAPAKLKAAEKDFAAEPVLLYARIKYLRLTRQYQAAAQLLKTAPKTDAELVDPSAWWAETRIVARNLTEAGKAQLAYDTVLDNRATSPEDRVEAAFHAGWFALRRLKDPKTAETHFTAILALSSRPVSVARAFYWLGRAAEAGGPGKSAEFYAKAASLSGTFYGQLAAARLKIAHPVISEPSITLRDEQVFSARQAVKAIGAFVAAGHGQRAPRLIRALAQDLDTPQDVVLLSRLALATGGQPLALDVGKIAYGRGINVPTLAWPIGAIPDSADTSGTGLALAYAVARQESAFQVSARSPANAIGLLQLLPETAAKVARRHKLPWQAELLGSDPAYNATLGAHYLREQIDEFDGSYILTLAAYNAGPKRVKDWLNRYGDPRGADIDTVVDWIERIPFSETRNYVQRVMENYQVYKARLGGNANLEADLVYGRRS